VSPSTTGETCKSDSNVDCHAVALLAFAEGEDGEPVAAGRDVTGFPNEWDEDIVDENDVLPDGRKMPYWVEDEVKAAGGNWDGEVDSDVSVQVDGDLVTARGPESPREGAKTLLDELGVRTSV
jgi:putative intracellular protease/amidase